MQEIINSANRMDRLREYIERGNFRSLLFVSDSAFEWLSCKDEIVSVLEKSGCKISVFNDIEPNPSCETVTKGIEVFNANACDAVFCVGGGSAIDTAKCIKLYCGVADINNFLQYKPEANGVKLIVMPTTAGTGSEATRYAVVYNGEGKQSVTDDSIIPDAVVFDERVLYSLPDYQKKCTLCDALFHAVESYWSVNSTSESKEISASVIKEILSDYKAYLGGDKRVYARMQKAAYDAGRAINITQTTAGHAMSYKLTSLFKIAHGHAVALCACGVAEYMVKNTDRCTDLRGTAYLSGVFDDLAEIFGGGNAADLPGLLKDFVLTMQFDVPKATDKQIETLAQTVNPTRMKNNPVPIDSQTAREIYLRILR